MTAASAHHNVEHWRITPHPPVDNRGQCMACGLSVNDPIHAAARVSQEGNEPT